MGTIKLRKEILEGLKEEGYQGIDLKVKVNEVFNQVLQRQHEEREWQDKERERIRQDKERERIRQYKERERIRQYKERERIRQDKSRRAEERRERIKRRKN